MAELTTYYNSHPNTEVIAATVTRHLTNYAIDPSVPITTSERLDAEEEQRLGRITGDILGDITLSTHLSTTLPGVLLTAISLDDYRDGEGLLDGLVAIPYLSLDARGFQYTTKGPNFYLDGITRTIHLGGTRDLTKQLTAFIEVVISTAVFHLDCQAQFYGIAMGNC